MTYPDELIGLPPDVRAATTDTKNYFAALENFQRTFAFGQGDILGGRRIDRRRGALRRSRDGGRGHVRRERLAVGDDAGRQRLGHLAGLREPENRSKPPTRAAWRASQSLPAAANSAQGRGAFVQKSWGFRARKRSVENVTLVIMLGLPLLKTEVLCRVRHAART